MILVMKIADLFSQISFYVELLSYLLLNKN
jgi:hypothetical protein